MSARVPRWLRDAGAVLAGFVAIVFLSVGTDWAMRAGGVFARTSVPMSGSLFLAAAAYRAVYTIFGGYLTARLAGNHSRGAAWVLAAIGVIAGVAGIFAYYTGGGASLGPAWYAYAIALMSVPCVLAGAWLRARQG